MTINLACYLGNSNFVYPWSEMPKAYSYIRFSTREQRKGSSVFRQTKQTRAFAEHYGLDLQTDSYEDLGVSAFRGDHAKNGALGQFIDAVEAGKISKGSWLLIESLDRLGRDQLNLAFSRFQHLLGLGITIATLGDNKVFRPEKVGDLGEIMVSLVSMSRAHEESVRKSQLSAGAWAKTRDTVTETGKAPAKGGIVPWWLKKKRDGSFIEISERADAIRQMFRWSLEGYGSTRLAQLMAEHFHDLDPNKAWTTGVISNLTRGKTVLGYWQPRQQVLSDTRSKKFIPVGDPVKLYPAIIEEGVWLRVQKQRKDRDTLTGRGASVQGVPNLFSGLLKCECGTAVKLQRRRSFMCRTVEYGKACQHRQGVLSAFLEPIVFAALHKYLKSHAITATSTDILRNELDETETQLAEARQEREQAEARASRALDLLLDDPGNLRDKLTAQAKKLEQEVSEVDSRLLDIEERRNVLIARLDESWDKKDDIVEAIAELSGSEDGRLKIHHALQQVVQRMTISGTERKLTVHFKPVYDSATLVISWDKPMRGRLKSVTWQSSDGINSNMSGQVFSERPPAARRCW